MHRKIAEMIAIDSQPISIADQHVNIEQTANFWDAVDTTVQQSTDSLPNEILAYTSLQKAEMSLTDPLQYWKQESRFPLLKATAKKYLSAPPGSVK